MEDAQVPPDAGDAKSAPPPRQALRLSDAEDVATARLDMFGDPSLKEALAGEPPHPDAETAPPGAAPAPAADPGAPISLPAPDAEQGVEIDPVDAGERAPGASEHPAAVVPAKPQAASAAAEPAGAAAEGARNGAALAWGPFGAPFMMPPGSPELEGADLSSGPMNEAPRFRDELMFVREAASDAIAADAAALPDAAPDAAALPPSSDLPQEPPFAESPAQLPEDPPGAPAFPEFAGVPPYPEEGAAFRDAAPLPPEPAPPFLDAASRITAEANATAEALANLKRLLGEQRHHLQPVETDYRFDPADERMVPPSRSADALRLRVRGIEAQPPPFTIHEPAPLMPLPVPSQPSGGKGAYLLGFLTGLALSLLAGGVLYFFIAYMGPG